MTWLEYWDPKKWSQDTSYGIPFRLYGQGVGNSEIYGSDYWIKNQKDDK